MRTIAITLLCALMLSAAPAAFAMSVDEVPNPRQEAEAWVSDTASVIPSDRERSLNATIDDLEAQTGAEIAVVTVDSVDAPTPKDFATELFNLWGIGKAGDDSGLLVLLVLDERRVEMETGYGLEGVLTDGWLKRMQQDEMVPAFKDGRYGVGLVAGVEASAARLLAHPDAIGTSPAARAAAPADDSKGPEIMSDESCVGVTLMLVMFLAIIASVVVSSSSGGRSRRGSSTTTSSSSSSSSGGGGFGGGSSGGGGAGSSF